MANQNSGMRPSKVSRQIRIPISWDIKQDKKNWSMTITLAVIIGVILLIYTIGMLISPRGIFSKFLFIGIPFIIYTTIYRFLVFKEGHIRNEYEDQKERDYEIDIKKWWRIFKIENKYPYTCHYLNGNKAIFIKVKKDVIQGKEEDIEFDHYERIADAYNFAASQNLQIMYIDYMDNVGNDERLEKLFANTSIGENETLENFLMEIYSNLQQLMLQNFSSFDVFVVYQRTEQEDLEYKTAQFLDVLREANYKSVAPMDANDIRLLTKELFNLENFSVIDACKETVKGVRKEIMRPIKLIHSNGKEDILNLTFEEEKLKKEKDRERERTKKQLRKQSRRPDSKVVHIKQSTDKFGKPDKLMDIFEEEHSLPASNGTNDTMEKTSMITDTDNLNPDESSSPSDYRTSVIDYNSVPSHTSTKEKTEEEADKDTRGVIDIFDSTSHHKPVRTSRGTFKKSDLDSSGKDPYKSNLDIFEDTPDTPPVPKTKTTSHKDDTPLDIF